MTKDDSAQEKDKTLRKLVADKLREQLRAKETGCPDAETWAAYFERVLTPSEHSACETHLATCMRCQEQVAELARLSEADEPVKELEGEVASPVRRTNVWLLRLAWATPLVVALVVVGLWYREDFRHLLQQTPQVAQQAPTAAQAPEVSSEAEASRLASAPLAKQEAAKPPSHGKEAAAPASPGSPAVPTTALPERGSAVRESVGAGIRAEPPAGLGPGAMAPPGERARLAAAAPVAGRVGEMAPETLKGQLADRVAAAGPPPGTTPESERGPTEENEVLARAKAREKATSIPGLTVLGFTSRAAPSWRVGRRGLIQRADTSGAWVTQESGVQSDLYDITFANPSAGWAVGQAGTILRTTDGGSTWSKVPSPSSEDLVRVSATSELAARVMTRSGKTLGTNDGGNTWNAIPPE